MKQTSIRVRAFLLARTGRVVLVSVVVTIYLLLVWLDAQNYFPSVNGSEYPVSWLYFICSSVVSLLFLVLGCYIWLYAREQSQVTHVLCAFCVAMMVCFSVQTASSFQALTSAQLRLACIGTLGAYTSLLFVNVLLLLFPKNLLTPSSAPRNTWRTVGQISLFFRVYISLFAFTTLVCCGDCLHYFVSGDLTRDDMYQPFFNNLEEIDAFLGLVSVLFLVLFSYRCAATGRDRRILRFLVVAIVLSFAPILIFTIIPVAFHMKEFIDTKVTSLAFACLPLALTYTVFGYQLLAAIDAFFRKSVEVVLSIILLMLTVEPLAYLEWKAFSGVSELLCIIITSCIMTPFSLFVGRFVTRWLFLQEVTAPQLLLHETIAMKRSCRTTTPLRSVVQQLYEAVITCCGTTSLLLMLQDEMYCPFPDESPSPFFAQEQERLSSLLRQMLSLPERSVSLDSEHDAVHALRRAERPVWVSEVSSARKVSFSRYVLPPTAGNTDDALLYPLRVSATLTAILVVSTREMSPPHETIELNLSILPSIIVHLTPLIERARLLYMRERRMETLTTLTMTPPIPPSLSLQQVATLYVEAGAHATEADVECWSYASSSQTLTRIARTAGRSVFPPAESFTLTQEKNWHPWYYGGRRTMPRKQKEEGVPPLLQEPSFPFAWLPLETRGERIGIIVLHYRHSSHRFSQHEQRMLEVFAQHCARSLSRVQTLERQKETLEAQRLQEEQIMQAYVSTTQHCSLLVQRTHALLQQEPLQERWFEQVTTSVRQGREVQLSWWRLERLLGKEKGHLYDTQDRTLRQQSPTSSVLVNAKVDAELIKILERVALPAPEETKKRRVVVAGANRLVCRLLSLLLSLKGHQVQLCQTLEEVLTVIQHGVAAQEEYCLLLDPYSFEMDEGAFATMCRNFSRVVLVGASDKEGDAQWHSLPWFFSVKDVVASLEG